MNFRSPHFGERWARHWMDWVRYADSHGSEGDPQILMLSLQNYLMRALNADVGYDQLVKEHAGDLMDNPRVNKKLALMNPPLVLHTFVSFFTDLPPQTRG